MRAQRRRRDTVMSTRTAAYAAAAWVKTLRIVVYVSPETRARWLTQTRKGQQTLCGETQRAGNAVVVEHAFSLT